MYQFVEYHLREFHFQKYFKKNSADSTAFNEEILDYVFNPHQKWSHQQRADDLEAFLCYIIAKWQNLVGLNQILFSS